MSRTRHSNFSNRFIPLAFMVFSLFFMAASPLCAEDTMNAGSQSNIDKRWLPWIGTWELNSYINFTANTDLNKSYSLKISPNDSGDGVTLEAFQEDNVLFEDSIWADGRSRPLKDEKCTGSYSYEWSDTGKRLIFKSESNCPDTDMRKVSGLSILNGASEWLDIQLIQSPEERIITIRRYKRMDRQYKLEGSDLTTKPDSRLTQRYGFTIDEIIELSDKIAPEILEAAVLEYRAPFTINAATLERLADANVPTGVIDLMMALTFPDEFIIERDTVSLVERASPGPQGPDAIYPLPPRVYYSIVDPYFPWYWTPYTYSLYWNRGWSVWPDYYYYVYPSGSGGGSGGDIVRRDSGRLVAGRGYTRVHPNDGSYVPARYAVERGSGQSSYQTYSGTTSSGVNASRSGSYSSGSTAAPSAGASSSAAAAPSYSGGGGSSGSSGGGGSSGGSGGYSGGGGSASASPAGYSSGGSGGGHASPR